MRVHQRQQRLAVLDDIARSLEMVSGRHELRVRPLDNLAREARITTFHTCSMARSSPVRYQEDVRKFPRRRVSQVQVAGRFA